MSQSESCSQSQHIRPIVRTYNPELKKRLEGGLRPKAHQFPLTSVIRIRVGIAVQHVTAS